MIIIKRWGVDTKELQKSHGVLWLGQSTDTFDHDQIDDMQPQAPLGEVFQEVLLYLHGGGRVNNLTW